MCSSDLPVLQVKAIYHRNDPIMTASPPARPTFPGTYYGTAGSALMRAASLWDELEAAGVPGVKGVFKLPGGGTLTPRLDYTYRSSIQTLAINTPLTELPDLSLMNLRLAWKNPSSDWSAVLSVTNLQDKFYYESQFGNGEPVNFSITRKPGWPRVVFLTLKRSF